MQVRVSQFASRENVYSARDGIMTWRNLKSVSEIIGRIAFNKGLSSSENRWRQLVVRMLQTFFEFKRSCYYKNHMKK